MQSTPRRNGHALIATLLALMASETKAQHIEVATPVTLPAITDDGNRYIVFDRQLTEHVFVQDENGMLQARDRLSGTLEQQQSGQFLWVDSEGNRYRFNGSWQQRSNRTFGSSTNTFDSAPRIRASANTHECQEVVLPPDSPDNTDNTDNTDNADNADNVENTDNTENADTQDTQDTQDNQITNDDPQPEQCDTDTEGPHTFQPVPYDDLHTTLDARPESCQSYFVQYYGTDRGFAIESGLQLHPPYNSMQATLRTFPVIDFMDDNGLYVVTSRDLGNRTFNSPARPDALLDQLLQDGEEIQTRFLDVLQSQGSISASEMGQTTTINADDVRPITLQLVIRDGIASPSHWQQIAIAREQLQREYGVTLEVVIIP